MNKASDYLEMYIEDIDTNNSMVVIGSLEYYPSNVLREIDPVAFRCGFNDFLDYMGVDSDELDWNVNL